MRISTAPVELTVDQTAPEAQKISMQLVMLLADVSKHTRALLGIKLAEIGVLPGQDQMLLALSSQRGIAVGTVADRLNIRPATVSKMIGHLKEKGWVVTGAHQTDHRMTMLTLTPKGLEVRDRLRMLVDDFEEELASGLEPEALTRIKASLAEIDDVLMRKLRRLR